MLARDGEVEMTSAVIKVDGEWTFEIDLIDGTRLQAEQRWRTKEEAMSALRSWVESQGGQYYTAM